MRDAVWTLIGTDPVLAAAPYLLTQQNVHSTFGLDGSRIQPNYSAEGYFIILRWEEGVSGFGLRTVLSIWVHKEMARGVDFNPIDDMLQRIREVMTNTFHRAGADGKKMSMAQFRGMGADQVDQGYSTITKYAVFDVFSGQPGR